MHFITFFLTISFTLANAQSTFGFEKVLQPSLPDNCRAVLLNRMSNLVAKCADPSTVTSLNGTSPVNLQIVFTSSTFLNRVCAPECFSAIREFRAVEDTCGTLPLTRDDAFTPYMSSGLFPRRAFIAADLYTYIKVARLASCHKTEGSSNYCLMDTLNFAVSKAVSSLDGLITEMFKDQTVTCSSCSHSLVQMLYQQTYFTEYRSLKTFLDKAHNYMYQTCPKSTQCSTNVSGPTPYASSVPISQATSAPAPFPPAPSDSISQVPSYQPTPIGSPVPVGTGSYPSPSFINDYPASVPTAPARPPNSVASAGFILHESVSFFVTAAFGITSIMLLL